MKIGGLQKSTAMREYKLQQSAEFKIKMNTMHIYLTQDWAAYTGKKFQASKQKYLPML